MSAPEPATDAPASLYLVEERTFIPPAQWKYLAALAVGNKTTVGFLIAELVRRGLPVDYAEQLQAAEAKRPIKAKAKIVEIQHGTKAGYQRGCRSDCPSAAAGGLSCTTAHSNWHRDYKKETRATGVGAKTKEIREREVAIRTMFDERMTVKEMSAALGISEGAVYKTIGRMDLTLETNTDRETDAA